MSDLGARPPLHSTERGRLHANARELIGVARQRSYKSKNENRYTLQHHDVV